MREIDSLLLSGSQPDKVERELAANQKRIEELLNETESKSKAVVDGIDELIRLAKSQESNQKNGAPPPPPGDGQGKPDQDPNNPSRPKSKDPSEPQQQPQPKPEPNKPQPNDGDPQKGKPDPTPGEQRDGQRPPPLGATGEFERTDLSGRWGMLPPKEAEDLQRRSADEFPQRYRPWMELYFRRVSRLPARR